MPASTRRFLLPVLLALACVAALIVGLLWQLKASTRGLTGTVRPGEQRASVMPVIETVDPRDTALMAMRAGDVQAVQGRWAAAREAYAQSVTAGGGLPALRKLAQAQLQLGDKDALAETIQRMRDAGATGTDIQLLETIIALRAGDVQKAQESLNALPEASSQRNYADALLAILQGDHERAQLSLAAVQAGSEPLLKNYAAVLSGAYDEFGLFPESPNIHLVTLLGRALAQIEECPLALPLLTQVTIQQPDYRDAWIVRGFCELSAGTPDVALVSLNQAYGLDPEKPETQYYLGRAYAGTEDHHNAITFLQNALKNGFRPERTVREAILEEANESADALLGLVQAQALAALEDATVTDAERAVTLSIQSQDLPGALSIAQAATQRWPQDGRSFDLLGLALGASGRRDEAKQALESALALNPNLQSAKDRLEQLR